MNNITKNIISVLGLLTVAFAGFYLYSQTSTSSVESDEVMLQQMLSNTQIFMAHSQELDNMKFDLSVLENKRFITLQSYTDPVESQPTGRPNPFSDSGND